jgi:hypothetical protein
MEAINVEICTNCLLVAVNDDRSSLVRGDPMPLSKMTYGETLTTREGEPYFSWSSCDTCAQTLGGERHPAVILRD